MDNLGDTELREYALNSKLTPKERNEKEKERRNMYKIKQQDTSYATAASEGVYNRHRERQEQREGTNNISYHLPYY